MYSWMSRSGLSFSRNSNCAVTVVAMSSSMTPRTKTTPSFSSREGNRQKPFGGDVLAAPFHLGQVRRRETGFAGDLGQGPVDGLPALAQHRAEGGSDDVSGFAVGERHSSVAKHTLQSKRSVPGNGLTSASSKRPGSRIVRLDQRWHGSYPWITWGSCA